MKTNNEKISLILKTGSKYRSDMIALWAFYTYAAEDNPGKVTSSQAASALKWTKPRVRRSKKALQAIGLLTTPLLTTTAVRD